MLFLSLQRRSMLIEDTYNYYTDKDDQNVNLSDIRRASSSNPIPLKYPRLPPIDLESLNSAPVPRFRAPKRFRPLQSPLPRNASSMLRSVLFSARIAATASL